MTDFEQLPTLAEARTLVTVLEYRSFSKAAKQLHLSPARTSEIIKALEHRLNVRLVERTTRSVSPTLAGEHLARRFKPVLETYRDAVDSLNDFRDTPTGLLRLTVAPPAADLVIAPIMGRFLAKYPDIKLDISIDRTFVDIVAQRFDAGIRPGERVDQDMIAVRISDPIPFAVATSPAYLSARGKPGSPADLAGHACIRFRMPDGYLPAWRFVHGDRLVEYDASGPLVANEPSFAIQAAIDGAGLIQLPRAYLLEAIRSGRLIEILGDWPQPQVDAFHIFYPSRRQMRTPLRALVAFLQEEYRKSASTS